MGKTFTPLRYPGGKSQFYKSVHSIIIRNNVQNATYIEPFAGGAGVAIRLLIEGVVDEIIINDIDYAIYSFWDTLKNETDWLINKIINTPVTISEWNKQKRIYLNQKKYSKRDVGFATLFLNRCNRSGILTAGPIGGKNQTGSYKIDCRFNKDKIISIIRMISFYKNRIKVYNLDATDLICSLKDITNSFWFIDPPYFVKGAELYKNSFCYNDHRRLSNVIKDNLKEASWILTYDVCDEIFELYKTFRYKKILLSYTVENKRKENEYLFFNNLSIEKELLL